MNTLLLVEDDANNITLFEDMFQFDNIPAELVSVETGEEAISRAVELRPALILMDLRLPGIDGLEAARTLKRHPATKDIPIWAITAYATKGDVEQARAAGCCEYIAKPAHVAEPVNRLRAFFEQLEHEKVAP